MCVPVVAPKQGVWHFVRSRLNRVVRRLPLLAVKVVAVLHTAADRVITTLSVRSVPHGPGGGQETASTVARGGLAAMKGCVLLWSQQRQATAVGGGKAAYCRVGT